MTFQITNMGKKEQTKQTTTSIYTPMGRELFEHYAHDND